MFLTKIIFSVVLFFAFYEGTKACFNNLDCFKSRVCCKPKYGNNICSDDCVGKSCRVNSDCGGYDEYCCNDKCQDSICGLAGWLVAVIVLCVLGGVATIIGVALCYYCSYRRRSPGAIIAAPATVPTTTTVVAGSMHTGESQVTYPAYAQSYPNTQPQVQAGYDPPPYYQPPQKY